jgi:hypothetical protein
VTMERKMADAIYLWTFLMGQIANVVRGGNKAPSPGNIVEYKYLTWSNC